MHLVHRTPAREWWIALITNISSYAPPPCRFIDAEPKAKRSKSGSNKARERQRDARERRRVEESRVRRYPIEDEALQEQLVQEAQAGGDAPHLASIQWYL